MDLSILAAGIITVIYAAAGAAVLSGRLDFRRVAGDLNHAPASA